MKEKLDELKKGQVTIEELEESAINKYNWGTENILEL